MVNPASAAWLQGSLGDQVVGRPWNARNLDDPVNGGGLMPWNHETQADERPVETWDQGTNRIDALDVASFEQELGDMGTLTPRILG